MNRLAMLLVLACTVTCTVGMGTMAVMVALASPAFAQPKPEFRLGFKALADRIPEVVGEALEDERWGPNGDSLQMTSKGLMAWRKADNWTAFTDGTRTWVNGPDGVKDRPNDERFEWEAAAIGLPIWFTEGIAEYCAFARDPQAVPVFGRVNAATGLFKMSRLSGANPAMFPALGQLDLTTWVSMQSSGEGGKRATYGIAYMAVKHLMDKVGTERVAQVLGATATGEPFEAALQRITGYSVDKLDAEYRTTISRAGWPQ